MQHNVRELHPTENVVIKGTSLHANGPNVQCGDKTIPMLNGTVVTIKSISLPANETMNMLVVDRMFLLKIKVNRTNELPITEAAIISTYKVTMVDCSGLLISHFSGKSNIFANSLHMLRDELETVLQQNRLYIYLITFISKCCDVEIFDLLLLLDVNSNIVEL